MQECVPLCKVLLETTDSLVVQGVQSGGVGTTMHAPADVLGAAGSPSYLGQGSQHHQHPQILQHAAAIKSDAIPNAMLPHQRQLQAQQMGLAHAAYPGGVSANSPRMTQMQAEMHAKPLKRSQQQQNRSHAQQQQAQRQTQLTPQAGRSGTMIPPVPGNWAQHPELFKILSQGPVAQTDPLPGQQQIAQQQQPQQRRRRKQPQVQQQARAQVKTQPQPQQAQVQVLYRHQQHQQQQHQQQQHQQHLQLQLQQGQMPQHLQMQHQIQQRYAPTGYGAGVNMQQSQQSSQQQQQPVKKRQRRQAPQKGAGASANGQLEPAQKALCNPAIGGSFNGNGGDTDHADHDADDDGVHALGPRQGSLDVLGDIAAAHKYENPDAAIESLRQNQQYSLGRTSQPLGRTVSIDSPVLSSPLPSKSLLLRGLPNYRAPSTDSAEEAMYDALPRARASLTESSNGHGAMGNTMGNTDHHHGVHDMVPSGLNYRPPSMDGGDPSMSFPQF